MLVGEGGGLDSLDGGMGRWIESSGHGRGKERGGVVLFFAGHWILGFWMEDKKTFNDLLPSFSIEYEAKETNR